MGLSEAVLDTKLGMCSMPISMPVPTALTSVLLIAQNRLQRMQGIQHAQKDGLNHAIMIEAQ